MSRFFTFILPAAVLIIAVVPAASYADDANNPAAAVEKLRPALQKQLASGTAAQQRLRLDGFASDGKGGVKVTGVYLDTPATKGDDKVPFEEVTDELFKSLREQLKMPKLPFDLAGITRVSPAEHPHIVLQSTANAAGTTTPAADQILLTGSRFGPTGALVLTGMRGKGDATGKWLTAAVTAALIKKPWLRGDKLTTDMDVKEIDWKLSAHALQKEFAAAGKRDGTPEEQNRFALRRLLVERVYFAYKLPKDQQAGNVELRFRAEGLRSGEKPVKSEWVEDVITPLVTDAVGRSVPGDYGPLVDPSLEEPVVRLQTAVGNHPLLDGVRVDPGFTFGPAGELLLAGLRPTLDKKGREELEAVVHAQYQAFGKGKAYAAKYARVATSPVSVEQMTVLPLGRVMADLRKWVIANKDDVKLVRLYFPENADALNKVYHANVGGLVLQYRPASVADAKDVNTEFRRLVKLHVGVMPPPPAPPPAPPKKESDKPVEPPVALLRQPPAEPAEKAPPLLPGLTAYLRQEMTRDPKWYGVLIERGYFDKDNRYTLRGVVDTQKQNDELAKLLGELKTDPKWAEYFSPPQNTPELTVIPMQAMVDRVKRVTPAYSEFDGVRVEGAHYDEFLTLVFDVHSVGRLAPYMAEKLTALLLNDKTYSRRVAMPTDPKRPAVKLPRVKLVTVAGPAYPDDQVAAFSMAFLAKLLTKPKLTKADLAKAKEWLDVGLLHYPNEAGVWFLSAYYNYLHHDEELVRRDLYRVVDLEGPLAFNGPLQRRRRYAVAKDIQGQVRNELETLWLDSFREVKDGARPITMTPK